MAISPDFQPQRILVCQLRQIGDVILATPAIKLLKEHYPQAEIHFFTEKKCAAVLENNPHLHKVWVIDKQALKFFPTELAYYWHVARQGFDLVVDFQQLPRCRWVVGFSGAKVRLSYPPPWYLKPVYTDFIKPLDGYAAMAKASVLRLLGIEWQAAAPQLFLTPAEITEAQQLLAGLGYRKQAAEVATNNAGHKSQTILNAGHNSQTILNAGHKRQTLLADAVPQADRDLASSYADQQGSAAQILISVDPTHRQPTRHWPLDHYAKLMALLGQDSRVQFLPLWGPGEATEIDELIALAQNYGLSSRQILKPPQMLTLRQMAACLAQVTLHLGNCSAPRHMAAALDIPTFTILGSTSSAWTCPLSPAKHFDIALNLPCQPCNRNHCAHLSCLTQLKPETVYARIKELFWKS